MLVRIWTKATEMGIRTQCIIRAPLVCLMRWKHKKRSCYSRPLPIPTQWLKITQKCLNLYNKMIHFYWSETQWIPVGCNVREYFFFEMQRRIAEILMPMQCIRIRIGIIINLRSISLAKILLNAVKKGFLFKADDGENNILQQ